MWRARGVALAQGWGCITLLGLLSGCTVCHDKYPDYPEAKRIVVFTEKDAVSSLRHVLVNWDAISTAIRTYEGPSQYQYIRPCVRDGLSVESIDTVHEYLGEDRKHLAASAGDIGQVDRLFTVSIEPTFQCAKYEEQETFAWMIAEDCGKFRVDMYLLPLEE